jgi:hypothetical protein
MSTKTSNQRQETTPQSHRQLRATRQLGFAILEEKALKSFGGALLKRSNPKMKRPITTKRPMHLVLWSAVAKGSLSLLRKRRELANIILKQGQLHGVQIYKQANGGNHLHLVIRPSSRKAFQNFVRSVTGLVARLVLGAERGQVRLKAKLTKDNEEQHLKNSKVQLWSRRPFTRIVEWGRDFKGVLNYLTQNTLEALGFIAYRPRLSRYRESTA